MKPFVNIYIFFVVFSLAVGIGRGFFPVWFLENGFSYTQIVIYFLIKLAIPPLILLLRQRFSTVKSLSLAIASEILLMISVWHIYHPAQLLIIAFLSGVTVVYFYLVYNTLFFENSPKDKKAFSAGLYFLASPFLGIMVPLIVGWVTQKYGFTYIFPAAIVLLVVCLARIPKLPKITFEPNLGEIIGKNKKLVILQLLDGIQDAVPLTAIPAFTLLFIKDPLPYGAFLSYLAIMAVCANLLIGYISDKIKNRTLFLYPAAILTALSIIGFGFAYDLRLWAIVCGFFGFISTIKSSFALTVILDKATGVSDGMVLHEFLVGVGRIIGSLICLIPLIMGGSPQTAMIFIGFIYLLFPIALYRQRIYRSNLAER